MIDFNKVEKVTNIVCKPTPTLTVKHIVNLIKRQKTVSANGFDKQKKLAYAFTYDMNVNAFNKATSNIPDTKGLWFSQGDTYIELEARRPNAQISQSNPKPNTVKVSMIPRDLPLFMSTLDNVFKWLTIDGSNVFIRDVDGKPMKIVNPLLNVGCPVFSGNISFKPCIIRDANDIRYEGIAMLTAKDGELCNFTAPEFALFRMMMHGLCNNLYMANLAMATQAMNYCMYENMMEALSKNGSE